MRNKTVDMIPVLSEQIKETLTSFSKSRSLSVSLSKRATIVLLASEGVTNQAISGKLGMHYNSVATWRNRFLAALPLLAEVESPSSGKTSGGNQITSY